MKDESQAPGIRRLCVAVDLSQYSRLDGDGQALAQAGISSVLTAAKAATGLSATCWHTQPSGDGEMAVLSPGISERDVIRDFVFGLQQALGTQNSFRSIDTRLRLRVAFHEGVIRVAEQGFAGRAAVTVNRLLDSEPVRDALRAHAAADLALIVSAPIYDDHVGGDYQDFEPASFRQVHIDMPSKDFKSYAWLWVPQAGRERNGIPQVGEPPSRPEPARPAVYGVHNSVRGNQYLRDQYNSAGNQNIVHGNQTRAHDQPRPGEES